MIGAEEAAKLIMSLVETARAQDKQIYALTEGFNALRKQNAELIESHSNMTNIMKLHDKELSALSKALNEQNEEDIYIN